jgi:Concanavalin A-like lectin/glucanases superfamily/Glycine rich protein
MRKEVYLLLFYLCSIGLNAQSAFHNLAVKKPQLPSSYSFQYTGDIQKFIVPNRVTSIQINAIGAKGGTGARGQAGGAGANITTTLNVTPGQVLYIVVGGFPGQSTTPAYGFGGSGGAGTYYGGAGGGLSGVFTSSSPANANALVVAGGGGGGAGNATDSNYSGGDAGNTATGTASNGNEPTSNYVVNGRYQYGYAASTSAPGLAGEAYDVTPVTIGSNGNDISGGAAGSDNGINSWHGAGGGGAGWFGGGGGAGGGAATGGGAGGSTKSSSGQHSFGTLNTTGNGSVTITSLSNSGLVFHLDAGSSSSYPGTGATWKDLRGVNDATLIGTPSYTSSIGLTFNGTNQYGTIPSVSGVTDFTNTQKYSIEIWFKPSNGQPTYGEAELLEKWNKNNESRYPFTIRFNEGTSSMSVACYDGSTYKAVVATGFPVNTWKQIVGVFDFVAKTLKIYRDGVFVESTSLVGINQVSNTSPIAIATRLQSDGSPSSFIMFKGTIGIIRIYNVSLTDSQILQNFNANKTRFGL